MLLREDLGRRHQSTLIAVRNRSEEHGERHNRLATADVSLKQAAHGPDRLRHVLGRLGERPLLASGELEGQRGKERLDHARHRC